MPAAAAMAAARCQPVTIVTQLVNRSASADLPRVERLAEAVTIIKGLLKGEQVAFSSRHYRVTGHTIYPPPVQQPHPPILIGGNGVGLLTRAAREADIVGFSGITFRRGGTVPDISGWRVSEIDKRMQLVRDVAGDLADLDRARGMDDEGAELLKKAMAIEPGNADVRYALGLYLVRKHDYSEALDLLRRAHELMADNGRYAYVYAVALNSTGAPAEAMALLEEAHRQHPADRDLLMALVSIARDTGDFAAALRHARELVTLVPGDTQLRALISELEKKVKPPP